MLKIGGLFMAKKKNENTVEEVIEVTSTEQKLKAAKAAISRLEKQFGQGIVQPLGSSRAVNCESISTGILPLDMAVGVRGLPKGRIVEIFGPESAGKTLIALQTIAETQKSGGVAAFVDVEHALNVEFAKKIGVDVDTLLVCQPDSGEQALEVCEELIRCGGIDILVVDSVAALTPQAEIDGDMGDAHVGLLARLMSQGLRKLNASISKTNTLAIFINQLREKVGVMYGNPEVTPGGRALKFYASVRLEVRKKEAIKNGGTVIGNRVKVKVVKNKVAPPFKECEFDLMFDSGASRAGSLVDIATEYGIINKSGSWFSYNGEKIGQGRDSAKAFIESNPNIYKEIEQKVYDVVEKASEEDSEPSTPSSTTNTLSADNIDVDIDNENFDEFDPSDLT